MCSFSLLVGLIIAFLSSLISEKLFGSNQYANLIQLVSVQLVLTNISTLGMVLLRFEKENLKFLKVIIVNVVFALIFVYFFVMRWKLGLLGVFYAQACALFLSATMVTFYVRRLFTFRGYKLMTKMNLKYALPQFPARIGSTILGEANRFFMLGYLTLGSIGIYSVSMKLASSIQLVNTAFILAWAPFMHAQFKNKDNKEVFANAFPLVVGATFLCVCLITLFSKEMVYLLATEEFYSSYKYVGGLALFFSLYIIKETIDIGPKIREKTKYLSLTFLLSVIVNITSLFLLTQLFELKGVVVSMIITNLFLVVLSWFISNKLYYIPFSIPKFIVLFLPAISLSISIMFFDWSFLYRICIAVFCLAFYGILIMSYYKVLKAQNLKF
ncbi:MAG: oligosaccharide flippase family protein [Ferruginibacter sp.]